MHTHAFKGILAFLLGFTLVLAVMGSRGHSATTILPPGETCFQQASGPVASGSINMFVPNTTTPKNTWKDSGQVTLNTNPIQLDANGCAVIYGTGQYRQQVFTGPVVAGVTTGTLLYDVLTTDTSAFNSVFWAGLAGGTPNAITVTDAGFNNTDGSVINFLALNGNTGATTLNVSGGGAIAIKNPTASGPIALTSGCIAANNPVSVVYSSSQAAFLLLTACQVTAAGSTSSVIQPQGYLTLASAVDSPILTTDAISSTSVFYTPYNGAQIPIWNGTAYAIFNFSQLTLTLTASNLASTLYDVFVFSNSGTPVLVTGPAWTNSGAGTSARGSGAGTTQLQRLSGLWVNQVQITGNNGVNAFTIPANQATYVGTILVDSVAGQVSNLLSFGTIRKWGVWNAYNRVNIRVQQGISTGTPVSYTYGTGTWRASNNFSTNTMSLFTGLAEEPVSCNSEQFVVVGANTVSTTIAVNWSSGTPTNATFGISAASNNATIPSKAVISPFLGLDTVITTEIAGGATTFGALQSNMTLQCDYRG